LRGHEVLWGAEKEMLKRKVVNYLGVVHDNVLDVVVEAGPSAQGPAGLQQSEFGPIGIGKGR